MEIELWYPKVKKNGIVVIHDYDHPSHPNVKIIIDDFIKRIGADIIKKDYYNVFFIKE